MRPPDRNAGQDAAGPEPDRPRSGPFSIDIGKLVLSAVVLSLSLTSARADGEMTAPTGWSATFQKLDVDLSNRLSREEFLRQPGRPALLRRDFMLFDFDRDDLLNKLEFAAAFGIMHSAGPRGPIPDPLDTLVQSAMEATDQSYEYWNLRPNEVVGARQFVTNFMKSISTDGTALVSGRLLQQADPDGDAQVNRDEALGFLQQQLGVRWGPPRLRDFEGRVVDFTRFLATDRDQNDTIGKVEFDAYWPHEETLEEDFAAMDRDADRSVTVAEFAHPSGPNWVDPVVWFRDSDENLDAMIDRAEMESATIGRRRNLIDSSFQGFDEDHDGKLSLLEYRLSMHGNVNYSWDALPQDQDRDGRLSFEEFEFNRADRFQLQRRYYFHRLDVDHDGLLSDGEFTFRHLGVYSMAMISVDGTETKELYRADSGSFDAPEASPDGTRVLFHRTPTDDVNDSRIVQLDLETTAATELCQGRQPSWSDDGTRFACTRNDSDREATSGIWIISTDGETQQRIADGWGAKWSPDGKTIAYLFNNGIWAYDVPSQSSRKVIDSGDHSYQSFWWNMSWSPDSRQIVLRGISRGRSDAVLVDMLEPAKLQVLLSKTVELGTDFDWSPDGRHVLFPMRSQRLRSTRVFEIDATQAAREKPIEAFSNGLEPKSGCFTPDGRWYICVFRH